MDKVMLTLQKRDITGKAVKQLRAQGIVPAVIHDHGKDSLVVQAEYQELAKAYEAAGKHHPVELHAGDRKFTALFKHLTYSPRYHSVSHVVFNAVKANEKVAAQIPVHVAYAEGNDASPAERAGLVVLHQLESVEVEALPKDLPDEITFDGEKLVEVGDHATVSDLRVPAGVTVKADPAHKLATVFEPSALQAANDAAGGEAEAEQANEVESEHESTAEEGTQAEENRPGGKKQAEPAKE